MNKEAAGPLERHGSSVLPWNTTEEDKGEEATAKRSESWASRAVWQTCCLHKTELFLHDQWKLEIFSLSHLFYKPVAQFQRAHSLSLSLSPLGLRKASRFQPVMGICVVLPANKTVDGGLDASSRCSSRLTEPQNPVNVHIHLILRFFTGTRYRLVGRGCGPTAHSVGRDSCMLSALPVRKVW